MAGRNVLFVTLSCCILSLSSAQDPPGATKCDTVAGPSCACQPPGDGVGVLDLSGLASQTGEPMFSDIGPDPNQYVYSYNPCFSYTQNADCSNVFVCQTSEDGNSNYAIANAGTEQIYYDEDNNFFLYYESTDGSQRKTKVHLTCDQSLTNGLETLTTDGDSKVILNYEFYLTSCHACPGGCTGKPPSSGNVAGGIGLGIIAVAIIALIVYFIIGAIIMKVKFNAAGSDIIPNKTFWISLPSLIKDGCLFVVSPCVKAARGRQGYQEAK